jgi:diguanylate cyclase (GGDEF)-like protein
MDPKSAPSGRAPLPRSPADETRRETRLRLILLALALVLVAGYALTVTEMGEQSLEQVRLLLHSDAALLVIGAVGAAVAICGVAYLLLRNRPRKQKKSAAEIVQTAAVAGRREILQLLEREVEANARSGRQLAVYLIDIDRFRIVNQVRGEGEGDDFLRHVGERLAPLATRPERLARIGDDEFVIIQPEAGGSRHAEMLARRIQETLRDACAQVPRQARPSASIGVALAPEHGSGATKLLHSAAHALQAAKDAGGDTFRIHSSDTQLAVEARLQMEKAISDGLQQGWFELHFQPQYDLSSRRLTGFEALARLNHPEIGEVLPGLFMPVADDSGLAQPLGEWILRDALATAAEWPDHLTLSLNVSLAQLRDGEIANVIIDALGKSNIPGERLSIELPEAALLVQSEAIDDQMRRLKSRGITLVLDDFGVDTSKLKLLSGRLVDAVKLDRTLVNSIGAAVEQEALLKGLIGTARSFELEVLAEGIERVEQAHFLVAHDCRRVQGFLFGRPARKRDLAAIVAKDLRNTLHAGDQTVAA